MSIITSQNPPSSSSPPPLDFELFKFVISSSLDNGNLLHAKLLFKEMTKYLGTNDDLDGTHPVIVDNTSKSIIYEIIIQLLKKSLKSGDFLIAEAEYYFSYLERFDCVTNLAIVTMLEMYRQSFEMDRAFLMADKYKHIVMRDDSGVLIARLILMSSKISDLQKRTQYGTRYTVWLKTDASVESRSMCFENLVACFLHDPRKCLEILQFMERNDLIISQKIKEYFYLQLEIKKMRLSEKKEAAEVSSTTTNLIEYLNGNTFWDSIHKSSTHIPNNQHSYEREHIQFEEFSDQFSSSFILSHYTKN